MAFAVLFSLAQTIDKIMKDDGYPISVDGKQQILSMRKQITSLLEFLEKFPEEFNYVERRIRDVANEAEDTIEHFMYEQLRSRYKLTRAAAAKLASVNSEHLYDFHCLKRVKEEIDSLAREMDAKISGVLHGDWATGLSSSSALLEPTGDNNIMVGFDEDLLGIKGLLCGHRSTRESLSIVGMAGIGKTTFARTIYDDPLITEHFDFRGWVTLSQDYKIHHILSHLLDSMNAIRVKRSGSLEELRIAIYQYLKGRRYLIVLDDMWSVEAWNDINMILPDDNNGSRIMLTTRLVEVASSGGHLYWMRLLNEDESFTLLRQKVFKHENLPVELEKLAIKIARSCKGLPLAIVLVGGILSTAKTPTSWKEIAENVYSSTTFDDADQIEKIISLSYTHLPHHLRPCFLYMTGFPEDYEIHVSKLIKLWIAEGFVKPNASKSLEEGAEEYLEGLVNRSLVLVTRRKTNGKMKSCSLHDLVRHLSRKKAQDENFKRRFSIAHHDLKSLAKTYASTIRSVIYFEHSESSPNTLRKLRLLRVFDAINADFYSLPAQVFELFHLRYLAFSCPMMIPAAISMLQNLQTLIIRPRKGSRRYSMDEVYLPSEIWDLPQLRHLFSFFDILPDAQGAAGALENLQTLSLVKRFVCSKRNLERIPNLKKLSITLLNDKYPEAFDHLHNLVFLCQLETLELVIEGDLLVQLKVNPVFPPSLKKLTLSGVWKFPWEYMRTVGSLTNLQVLKLRDFACKGRSWETIEGEFCSLEYLLIDRCYLVDWITESSHFPRLQRLMLYRCSWLNDIPSDIGEIPTLELIEVDQANKAVVESAKRIQKEQIEMGNEELQVRWVRYHYQVRYSCNTLLDSKVKEIEEFIYELGKKKTR